MVSPVEASSLYLCHMRDAWNHIVAGGTFDQGLRFEEQEIVLTVPASFDEEARELTVEAARKAGIEKMAMLEEPLAAFYDWIKAHRSTLKQEMRDNELVLVCDVGGGTTDFSLIRTHLVEGEVHFERQAVGEHLLLGGDNLDLALARGLEQNLNSPKLSLVQRRALERACSAAKERLLSDSGPDSLPISILGSGRSVVGGSLTTQLTREEVLKALQGGFLPLTAADDLPTREKRAGLRELSLPYASEPAITRHLAAFLTQAGLTQADRSVQCRRALPRAAGMVRPDAILFNGGFFTPAIARERIVEAVRKWFNYEEKEWQLRVLSASTPESAVALGAAYYGWVRRSGGLRIRAGSARTYYIGVEVDQRDSDQRPKAVCVLPAGTEEGTTLPLEAREFKVLANRPVSFTLYSSNHRHDAHEEIVTVDNDEIHRHAPLVTLLRFGKNFAEVEAKVRLRANYTDVGTLELWCDSLATHHKWRLDFQLRGAEPTVEDPPVPGQSRPAVPDSVLEEGERVIRAVFGDPAVTARQQGEGTGTPPQLLMSSLETILRRGRDDWPMSVIRRLADTLAALAEGRRSSSHFEARWLNLFGFCLRPGFGDLMDAMRIVQARKIYPAGLIFPNDFQCQAEWLILWRRVAGGLSPGQQRDLYQKYRAPLGIGMKKPGGRLNSHVEREGWRLLASLEHLPVTERVRIGEALLSRLKRDPVDKGYLWSLGRVGARIPLYGALNCVVPVDIAAQWLNALLQASKFTPETAAAIVNLGARTDDRSRDIPEDLRQTALTTFKAAGVSEEHSASLREHVPVDRSDAVRIFGESLPEGLRLLG